MSSIREHCCGANVFFDSKMAKKQYRQYLKKGPTRITAKIIEQLSHEPIEGKTLLDVGGGIGALQWWFLNNNGAETTDIDASSGYLQQAKEHAAENGWEARTRFLFGDYVDVYKEVGPVDFITLDKMVCCYPEYEQIITISCEKAQSHVALSYPIDGLLSQIITWFGVLISNIKGRTYRPYMHPVQKIRDLFTSQGFERISHTMAFPWHIETYRRVV